MALEADAQAAHLLVDEQGYASEAHPRPEPSTASSRSRAAGAVLLCAAAGLLASLAVASGPRGAGVGPRSAREQEVIRANSEHSFRAVARSMVQGEKKKKGKVDSGRPPLELAALFGSHMVLPAGIEVKLFGWAKPDSGSVTVQVDGGEELSTEVDFESWRWEVTLPSMDVSMTPVKIVVTTELDSITLTDVVFGDLYMCVGASNIDFQLDGSTDAATALKETKKYGDRVRIIKVKKQEGKEPSENFEPKFGWQRVQNDNNTAEFSALCYFFGVEQINRRDGTPVGLIQASFGATACWQWSPREALEKCVAPIDEDAGYGEYWEPRSSSVLWYGMMSPWSALNVKALVLNLQGDKCIMPFMIQFWRNAWADKGNDEPAVAAAQFGCNAGTNGDPTEVTLARWDQMHFLEADRTVLVPTYDFCDPASPYAIMHSPFKREEAGRLAEALEAVTQGNDNTPEFFPVPTAVYTDPWDYGWGRGDDFGSKDCRAQAWGIRVEFDQDLEVRPEFEALLEKFPHVNGFTLYPAIQSKGWNVPVKLDLTEVRGNILVLNTTLSIDYIETDSPWPGELVYADGAFPITPLTNGAGHPVGTFKVKVPLEPGNNEQEFSLFKRSPWSPEIRAAAIQAGSP